MNLILGICLIDIPRGEWPQIIQLLISITSNENLNCRLSSIITIGYISQELSPGHLSTHEVDEILSALIRNMTLDTDLEILKHATLSFLNFLFFARKNMENYDEKNVIFNTIFNLLSHNNVDVRIYAMQCLVEISRIYYSSLESHIDALLGITKNHMLNDDERVSIQAYEFWCSVSDEEIKCLQQTGKSNCYCDRVLEELFNIIKVHLMNRNIDKEKLNDDSWSNVKAASCLLTNLSLCTNDRLIKYVFDLISDNLNSENPKNRDSTILAFGSILETNHKTQLKSILPGAIPTILGMLEDKNNDVRYTVSWCIKKITELHSDSLQDVNLYNTFMTSLIQNFYNSKKVVVHILDAINNLVTNLKPDTFAGQTSSYVSCYMEQLLPLLLKVAFEKDAYDPNNNIALGAFFTMGSLIDYAPFDTYHIINDFFIHILTAFQSALDQKNFTSKEMMYSYQTYIATVISACTAGEKVKINKDEAKTIYDYFRQSFHERQGVYEEGLMACSSIALLLKEDFMDIIPDFGMYLNLGLREWNEVSLCRIAINSTSDLIRSMGECMNIYLEQIYPNILAILEVI